MVSSLRLSEVLRLFLRPDVQALADPVLRACRVLRKAGSKEQDLKVV